MDDNFGVVHFFNVKQRIRILQPNYQLQEILCKGLGRKYSREYILRQSNQWLLDVITIIVTSTDFYPVDITFKAIVANGSASTLNGREKVSRLFL